MQAKVPRRIVWGKQPGRVSFSTGTFELGFSQEATKKTALKLQGENMTWKICKNNEAIQLISPSCVRRRPFFTNALVSGLTSWTCCVAVATLISNQRHV